ncbi:hypothetical protein AB3S75_007045 [Citrus x aurantiifolia]
MAKLANHVASINCFMNNLIKWRLNAVIKEKIRNMCISPFLKTKDKVDKDRDLIVYLVSLPIDDLPVIGKEISRVQAARCLGIGEDVFGKLGNHFQDMPIDGEEQFCMLLEHTDYIYLGSIFIGSTASYVYRPFVRRFW